MRRGDTMNSAVRGRRLATPVRIALATVPGAGLLDGAWWPRTASVATELPELVDALSRRLGEIIGISVNWSSLESSPDLDALNCARSAHLGQPISHHRLMTITGSTASATLLVVPCRTPCDLALMVLRLAAMLSILPAERGSQIFRTADGIVCSARTQSAQCAQQCDHPEQIGGDVCPKS